MNLRFWKRKPLVISNCRVCGKQPISNTYGECYLLECKDTEHCIYALGVTECGCITNWNFKNKTGWSDKYLKGGE